ncbi:superoxide dismutase family protein [uncultured Methylobacterium sp.]|uniref:superoxide dismutase family protein n=1 Tax=uncultured Methylobacterium sp. TaxID=157278 RepID=UPI0035C94620
MTSSLPALVRAATVSAALAAAALLAPVMAQTPPATAPAAVPVVESDIVNAKGEPIGRIAIRDGANALVLRLTVQPGGLPPGWHGLHFHAVGDCSDTRTFEKSKAHVNHDQSKHGLLNPDGPDEGDLPNIHAHADGSVNAEVSSDAPINGEGGLKDGDGSALIIHADADDHTTQPIGGAGPRIACAVIK